MSMRSLMFVAFSCLGTSLCSLGVGAQVGGEAPIELKCLKQAFERIQAREADDWLQVERMAVKFIKECRSVETADSVASAVMDAANASLKLRRPKHALGWATACINEVRYSDVGCHVMKVEALLQLREVSAARSALDVADKLVSSQLGELEGDIVSEADRERRERAGSKLCVLRLQKDLLVGLRGHYFGR